jgi:hypothetical protein
MTREVVLKQFEPDFAFAFWFEDRETMIYDGGVEAIQDENGNEQTIERLEQQITALIKAEYPSVMKGEGTIRYGYSYSITLEFAVN